MSLIKASELINNSALTDRQDKLKIEKELQSKLLQLKHVRPGARHTLTICACSWTNIMQQWAVEMLQEAGYSASVTRRSGGFNEIDLVFNITIPPQGE